MTIKRKFLITVLVIFVTLGVVGWLTGVGVRDNQREQVSRSMDALSTVEVARISDHLASLANTTADSAMSRRLAAELSGGRSLTPEDRQARLNAIFIQFGGEVSSMKAGLVLDIDGQQLADTSALGPERTPQRTTLSDVTAAIALIERGALHATGPAFRITPDDERFVHVIPMIHEGVVAGYLATECDLLEIRSLVSEYAALGSSSEAHLVQRTPTGAQLITDLRFRPDSRFVTEVPTSQDRAPAMLALTGKSGTYENLTDYRGEKVIASLRKVPGTQWALVVKIDTVQAYGSLTRALTAGLVAFSIAGVLSLALIVFAFSSLLRRIRRVSASATAITEGRFESRVGDLSPDELGVLARSFDNMADKLVADMTKRREAEAQLEHSAGHDVLTALPNRATFQRQLKRALVDQKEPGTVAVLFCDLDEFKTVNDDLGHSAGDALLREVAQRLESAVGARHVLARFGGDEFVVVARDIAGPAEALEIAQRMREALANPISLAGRDVFVTTSVGVAASRNGSTAETLVRDADAAMYRAKDIGRHRVVMYNETIGARANNRLSMTTELHRAITHGGLTTAAQPIVNLQTGEIYAYEILVRWSHGGKEIDPSEFVTRATELDLAGALDRWVLDEACRSMRRLLGTTEAKVGWLHVNATGTSLIDTGFAEDVLRTLEIHSLPASALCLEIVEDRLGDASQDALDTLAKLRSHGVRVALDDFGTGHSSLARLRDLPADTVKIDQAFVRDLATDRASLAITSSIISLAHELGLEVVAEGIEQPEQRDALLRIGCRYGQGYLLCPPRPVSEVVSNALDSHRVPRMTNGTTMTDAVTMTSGATSADGVPISGQ